MGALAQGRTWSLKAARELRDLTRDASRGGGAVQRRLRYYGFRLAERFTPVLAVDTDGLRFVVSTHDLGIGMPLFVNRAFELDEMRHALTVLERTAGHPFAAGERDFVDVGANIGTAIIPAVRHYGARGGVAFEPDHANAVLLRQNLVANDLGDRVRVVEAAVSDACATLTLERRSDNWGDHRVAVGAAGPDTVQVPAVTLDDQAERGVLDVDRVGLVWIDTQGHEAHVLAGAAKLRERGVPVVLEYWPHALRAAGGYERLQDIVAQSYTHYVDLHFPFAGDEVALHPAADITAVDATLDAPTGFTNVLLLA